MIQSLCCHQAQWAKNRLQDQADPGAPDSSPHSCETLSKSLRVSCQATVHSSQEILTHVSCLLNSPAVGVGLVWGGVDFDVAFFSW